MSFQVEKKDVVHFGEHRNDVAQQIQHIRRASLHNESLETVL